jgi:uncharacterized protein YdaU (DUF1376 family)
MAGLYKFDFYTRDWLTGVQNLSDRATGFYSRLIAAYYDRGGPIPNDLELLTKIGSYKNMRSTKHVLAELLQKKKFHISDGSLVNDRAEIELAKARSRIERAGKGGSAKSARNRTDIEPISAPYQTENEGSFEINQEDALCQSPSPSPSPIETEKIDDDDSEKIYSESHARAREGPPQDPPAKDPPPRRGAPKESDVKIARRCGEIWNEELGAITTIQGMSDQRVRHLTARLGEPAFSKVFGKPTAAAWREFCRRIAASDFLAGKVRPREGAKPFKLTIDWVLNPTNFLKILEGRYGPDPEPELVFESPLAEAIFEWRRGGQVGPEPTPESVRRGAGG